MKRLLAILAAILASLICAATGGYILWQFHTNWGLIAGASLILLAVAIALPVPFHAGVTALKEDVVVIVPVVVGALKGGNRKTNPPAEPPPKERPSEGPS